jgi:hypothetical protein
LEKLEASQLDGRTHHYNATTGSTKLISKLQIVTDTDQYYLNLVAAQPPPAEPGCYMRMLSMNFLCQPTPSWLKDTWGEKHANSFRSKEDCLKRKITHDTLCAGGMSAGKNVEGTSEWAYVSLE